MAQDDNSEIIKEFQQAVNMTAGEINRWLSTDKSKEVGQKRDGKSESTGHESGREIVDLLHKKHSDYTDEDFAQMHRVVSYVKRHSAQKPSGDVTETHWRYSLMNWGHDPLKK